MGTVAATMGTSAIWIDRLRESDVGRVVARNHALRVLDTDDGLQAQRLVARILEPSVVGAIAIPDLEAALDVRGRATALHDFAMRPGCGFQRHDEILRKEKPLVGVPVIRKKRCG